MTTIAKYRKNENFAEWFLSNFTMEQVEGHIDDIERENVRLRLQLENNKLTAERLVEERNKFYNEMNNMNATGLSLRIEVERLQSILGKSLSAGIISIDGVNLIEENERLAKWVNDLQSGMFINCVYCGHRYGPREDTPVSMADVLKKHIEGCPKHPMSALKKEMETLTKKLSDAEFFIRLCDDTTVRELLTEREANRKAFTDLQMKATAVNEEWNAERKAISEAVVDFAWKHTHNTMTVEVADHLKTRILAGEFAQKGGNDETVSR
jgi:hypothetical protein